MHVLITGHTGFKGAWLAHLLLREGHELSGIALDPLPGGIYERTGLAQRFANDLRLDIRDADRTRAVISSLAPDAVVHLAAQPLVRASYADPQGTMETNVDGTLHVLQGIADTPSVHSALIITTDKVYRNVGKTAGYVETDALGGDDPYSASKAMADILTQSWVRSFPGAPTAIARAGNVIGGGDVSPDRLLPDLVRAFTQGHPARLRYPRAVRPWQHVLDCLSGYLAILASLEDAPDLHRPSLWNIGPDPAQFSTVDEVAHAAAAEWGSGARLEIDTAQHPHEASLLTLDSTRAHETLGWRNRLDVGTAVRWTVEWEKRAYEGGDSLSQTLEQIETFWALGD